MFLNKFLNKQQQQVDDEPLNTLAEEEAEPSEEAEVESVLGDFLAAIEDNKSDDVNQILGIVLAKARRITKAEAGSIFITRPVGSHPLNLLSCATQNDIIQLKHRSFTIPVNTKSIAGYVAQEGEVLHIDDLYNIDIDAPYTFNRSFDDKQKYRSISMLAFPLKNFNKEVIGMVQLINHIAGIDEDGNTKYSPFPLSAIEQMKSIMTILGVMVERIDLLGEIHKLRNKV